MSKVKEVNVEDLLNNLDDAPKVNKDIKKVKQDDWAEDEDNNFAFQVGDSKGASKAKTSKKKPTVKGWTEAEENNKQAQPASGFAKIQEEQEKKQKIMKKPGETRTTQKVVIDEYFPTLGEEPKEPRKKPEPTPTTTTTVTETKPTTTGPRKFVNAKKGEKGEHFVELDPKLVEKIPEKPEKVEKVEKIEKIEKTEKTEKTEKPENGVETVAPRKEGIFQRNAQELPKETTPPADTKFKFGGEGPKKFTGGAKISFKREEEKSEQEELRLQKEREIEEKLAKEREELAKKREQREQQKKTEPKPDGEGKEGKGPIKFTKSKKEGDKETAPRKTSHEKPLAPAEKPVETLVESKPVPAKEKIEIHGNLSTKGWGDGAILKKPVKK